MTRKVFYKLLGAFSLLLVVHARGREAVLYAARAAVDLIFHAYYLDDECIEEMLKSGSAIGPTLTFLRNVVDFTQPHEPAATTFCAKNSPRIARNSSGW